MAEGSDRMEIEYEESYYEKQGFSKIDVNDPKTREDFLQAVLKVNPNANTELIGRAYDFSKKAHESQKRKSGEPYFVHTLETAYVLLELKPGSSTLCAGLMHDVIEDTNVKPETIKKEFGEEILHLIEGVTKISNVGRTKIANSENLRKVILAMSKDIRIILIKLADRLHNLRTLKYLSEDKQKRIARESLEIFAPIAYKLGMYKIKAEMEDLCLRYLDPKVYFELKDNISETKAEREENVHQAMKLIKDKLKEKNIDAKIYGRAKHFYSIYNKMKKKNRSFNQLNDLLAIRVITKSIEDCYRVLGIVHESFTPIPSSMTDYIANPKPNMYQSLHTDVIWKGKPLEIQIRTQEMQYTAEYGIASHWRYKGTDRDKKFDKRLEWLKQILDWQMNEESSDRFIENFKIDLFQNEIVTFTPKGTPIALPEDSTPIDFAFEIHTDIGYSAARAKVNGVLVPLDKILEPGDIVEIITQKNAKPSRGWLQFVKTSKARSKIRQSLNLPLDNDFRKGNFDVDNVEGLLSLIKNDAKKQLRYSKCCKPQYGDDIAGYVMKDGRVAVHKKDCDNLQAYGSSGKMILLKWKQGSRKPNISMRIETNDRIGMLAEILNLIAGLAIDVRNVKTKKGKESFFVIIDLVLPEDYNPERVRSALRELHDVKNVEYSEKKVFGLI